MSNPSIISSKQVPITKASKTKEIGNKISQKIEINIIDEWKLKLFQSKGIQDKLHLSFSDLKTLHGLVCDSKPVAQKSEQSKKTQIIQKSQISLEEMHLLLEIQSSPKNGQIQQNPGSIGNETQIATDIYLRELDLFIKQKEEQKQLESIETLLRAYQSNASNVVMSLQRIKRFVETIQKGKAKNSSQDQDYIKELNFAINNIKDRNIYVPMIERQAQISPIKTQESALTIEQQWMTQHSPMKFESPAKLQESQQISPQKNQSIRSLLIDYDKYQEQLNKSTSSLFNLFEFTNLVGRDKSLSLLALHQIYQHQLDGMIDERKYARFLGQVQNSYNIDVAYHNDLHGIDVAQVANLFLTNGDLIKIANLSNLKLDILAFLTAGLCHDLGHDGFTNGFHSNMMTDRAIMTNDVSVQESYHVAQTFKLLRKSEYNFIDKFSNEEFRHFRKRVIGCILATDMAKHAKDLSQIKDIVESKGIKEGQNNTMIIDCTNETTVFNSQQFILECCLHACDLSQIFLQKLSLYLNYLFKISKHVNLMFRKNGAIQTHLYNMFLIINQYNCLVFDEFFKQGDVELKNNLPYSLYCDRKTTVIPKTQPGFLMFVVLPLWNQLAQIMPGMNDFVERGKKNIVSWGNYEETEEDKKYY